MKSLLGYLLLALVSFAVPACLAFGGCMLLEKDRWAQKPFGDPIDWGGDVYEYQVLGLAD